jgi:hypothetical protein
MNHTGTRKGDHCHAATFDKAGSGGTDADETPFHLLPRDRLRRDDIGEVGWRALDAGQNVLDNFSNRLESRDAQPAPESSYRLDVPPISLSLVFLTKKTLKPPPTTSETNTPPGVATCHLLKRSPPGSGGLGVGGST